MSGNSAMRIPTLIEEHGPVVGTIYQQLIAALDEVGPYTVEEKKTSLHICRKSAFAGVHPRARALLLNLRYHQPIESDRVRNVEQVSKNRYHSEILLDSPDQVDSELIGWLRAAYTVSK